MIAMVKAHTPINWENEPSYNTPLNAANLNKMDSEIGILDDRIIAQDTSKLDKSTANTMVKDVTFNESTGIFTITLLNGSTKTLDTKLEKIATNFRYDYSTQKLILTLVDGTTQEIDMSALLTQYEFTDSATIDFSVGSDGKITATIKNGSITENMLQPNYLAEIKVESAKAETNAIKSQSYAVGGTSSRQNEDIDNARYYYEQAKSISESFSGALVPMGTVAFEDLPSLEDAVSGWMYNISNEFVTTDKFKEGAGYTVPLGANVFKTFDGFWDVLAGSPVTGIKGSSETSYRRGNVNITASNIGLGNVNNTSDADKPISTATQTALNGKLATSGDSKNNTVTFTSNDVSDGSATSWTSVSALASGITHATFFARVSQMFKNVRYLYKMLGTTDISSVGDGTVKGAISTLNSNLSDTTSIQLVNGQIDFTQYKYIDIVFQDLSINNFNFTKRYRVWNEGSSYHDGYIMYANDSIYVVKFTITFSNKNITTLDAYFCNLAGNGIVSCDAPYIQAIYGHK